jgi:hypothetical protein
MQKVRVLNSLFPHFFVHFVFFVLSFLLVIVLFSFGSYWIWAVSVIPETWTTAESMLVVHAFLKFGPNWEAVSETFKKNKLVTSDLSFFTPVVRAVVCFFFFFHFWGNVRSSNLVFFSHLKKCEQQFALLLVVEGIARYKKKKKEEKNLKQSNSVIVSKTFCLRILVVFPALFFVENSNENGVPPPEAVFQLGEKLKQARIIELTKSLEERNNAIK